MKFVTSSKVALAALTVGALFFTGCAGSPDSSGGASADSSKPAQSAQKPLTVRTASAPTFQENFNPLVVAANMGSTKGLIYEPLVLFTPWNPGVGEPWLATAYEFNEDGTQLTFDIREGVKWSDGTDFTANDVAYTFNVLKDFPATNLSAIPVESATAEGQQVVLKLSAPSFALMPTIGNTVIIPEHVFSKEADLATFTNPKPVGTGPYVLKSFSPQRYTVEKNPNYWGTEGFEVNQINMVTEDSATFVNNLIQGNIDWAGGFIQKVQEVYIDKDPKLNNYWFPGAGLVHLAFNNQSKKFSDINLKKAIALGVDRKQIADLAFAGYAKAPNETGLILPAYKEFLAPDKEGKTLEQDVAAANKILDDAGYKKGSDGMRMLPSGDPLKLTLSVPSNYTDWITVTQLLDEQLAEIGIDLEPQGIAEAACGDSNRSGEYDIAMSNAPMFASPYFFYRGFLSSELSAPAGSPAKTNISRWEDPETDQILKDFAGTNDEAKQLEAIHKLGEIVATEMPVIPLVISPTWGLYRTANWTGFPSENDPYAAPTPYTYPDNLLVVRNLTPASK